jgi:uncharacterized protein YndB with AHSA1/START domain
MSNTAQASIVINTPASVVWDGLTNPAIIKQYMFGTDTTSDWKKGSTVTYTGEWEGKPYKDTGVILEVEPNRLLVMDYSSSFSEGSGSSKDSRLLTYKLETQDDSSTVLTVTQDNNPDAAAAQESTQNWQYILGELKKLLEQ